MEVDETETSGYSSCSSSTLLGPKKWQYKMQNCAYMPNTSAFKYYEFRYNRHWKSDPSSAMERIERQQLLCRKRKRIRQLNFESARSTEYASSSETTCDVDEFAFATNQDMVMEEDRVEFTDDDLIMAEENEHLVGKQIEDNAFRIDINLYSPESLIEAELESELSDSEVDQSFLDSSSDTEHEEDGYLTSEFFEHDEESESESEDQEALQKLVNFVGNGPGAEIVRHRFPYLSMRVFLSDFMCLNGDEFVNDTIVDFCLNHLIFNILPEDLYKIHALPSTFWYLMQVQLLEDTSCKTDSLPEKLMRRYSRLIGFIEYVELFDQDFLVLPINSMNHWSLCVICCPNKLLDNNESDKSNVIEPKSSILMFDSQMSNQKNLEKYGQQIREFVQFAYMYQNGYSENLSDRFSDQNCPIVVPSKLPRQANQFDCGVYALEYAKHFFTNPPNMRKVSQGEFEFLTEYPTFNISKKRASLKEEILSMSQERDHFERLLGYRVD